MVVEWNHFKTAIGNVNAETMALRIFMTHPSLSVLDFCCCAKKAGKSIVISRLFAQTHVL
jgi:hypothetical protein